MAYAAVYGRPRYGETMDWNVIPAEYDLPSESSARCVGRWLIALAAVAIIVGAGLALVRPTETDSSVEVPTSK